MYYEVFGSEVSCVYIYKLVMIQSRLRSRCIAKITLGNNSFEKETLLRTQSYELIRWLIRSPPTL